MPLYSANLHDSLHEYSQEEPEDALGGDSARCSMLSLSLSLSLSKQKSFLIEATNILVLRIAAEVNSSVYV
jgi:hypothetical protein